MTRKIFLLAAGFILLAASSAQATLTAGATYSVVLSKVNSNGTTTDVTSTTSVADANGKIGFTFSSIPTNSDANFLVVTVKGPTKNASGTATPATQDTVVSQSLAPAPTGSATTSAGVNGLSTVQTQAMLAGFVAAKSDDPPFASFGFILLRQPGLSAADISNISSCGRDAILGSNGFEAFLTNNGVTAAQLTTFKQKIVYNAGFRSLPDFASKFKDAVDHSISDAATATQDMAQGAGFMGDIFIDAANAAGIDLSLIVAGFKAAGAATGSTAACANISTTVNNGIGQAIKTFFTRISTSKVKGEYTKALTVLGASGSQVDRFNSAVNSMISCMQSSEATFAKYFERPDQNQMSDSIKNQMDTTFQLCFTTFQSAIASTDAECTTLRANMASAFSVPGATLTSRGICSFRDSNGTSANWPIPQAVLYQWLITNVISAGGSLTYTRDTLTLPSSMSWLAGRTDYSGVNASLTALEALEEDLRIIEMSKFDLFRSGVPTRAQEQAAELLFQQRMVARQAAIGGTTNGTTAISADIKKSIVRLTTQPNIH